MEEDLLNIDQLCSWSWERDPLGHFKKMPENVKTSLLNLNEEEVERLKNENEPIYHVLRGLRGETLSWANSPEAHAKGVETKRKKKLFSDTVREILDDPKLLDSMLGESRPAWLEEIEEKTGRNVMAAVMMAKAIKGNTRAFELLAKTGFPNEDKQTLVLEKGFFDNPSLKIEVVEPQLKQEQESEEQHSDEDVA